MTEIMLETSVNYETKFDGSDWHLNILGEDIGPGMTAKQAGVVLWWFSNSGLQCIMNMLCKIIEKAFREREANG